MIDFHSHIDLYPDPQGIVRRCSELGIYVLSVTTTPSAWTRTAALSAAVPRVRTALGLHPQLAQERKHEMALFRNLIRKTQYVGEVGLDGSPECKGFWNDQLAILNEILELCTKHGGKVISIHSRRAASSVLGMLRRYPAAGIPILHWFSGNNKELREAIDLGCWFSVGPAMISSAKSREQIAVMPVSRILTETDGPFAREEGVPLYPWNTNRVIEHLSATWKTSTTEVQSRLLDNLKTLGSFATGR